MLIPRKLSQTSLPIKENVSFVLHSSEAELLSKISDLNAANSLFEQTNQRQTTQQYFSVQCADTFATFILVEDLARFYSFACKFSENKRKKNFFHSLSLSHTHTHTQADLF